MIFVVIGVIIGAMMGSFACCQVRRMRRKEEGSPKLGKWSVCEKCGKRLKKRENIPVVSWLVQKGKCTKCGARIGMSEILSEVGLAAIFGILGYIFCQDFWQTTLSKVLFGGDAMTIVVWLKLAAWGLMAVAVVLMWMVTIYDAKWGEMPAKLLWAVVGLALAIRILMIFISGVEWFSLLGAVAILPGLYLVLYLISPGKLVGDGDWVLALAVALILGDWRLAFFALFLSNAMASVVAVAIVVRDKRKAKKGKSGPTLGKEMTLRIPFGPYLVLALIVVLLFAPQLQGLIRI